MADANSVSPGLATLGAGGWTVTEPSAGGRFGSVGVLTPQQTLATQALVSGEGLAPYRASSGYFLRFIPPSGMASGDTKAWDRSPNRNDGTFQTNLTAAAAWATSGALTQKNPDTVSEQTLVQFPAIGFDYANGECLLIFWRGRATPEGSDQPIIANTINAATANGIRVTITPAGKFKIAAYQTAGGVSSSTGASTATVAETSLTHSFAVCLCGSSGVLQNARMYKFWADGVADASTPTFLNFNSGNSIDCYQAARSLLLGGDGNTSGSIQFGLAMQTQELQILRGRIGLGAPGGVDGLVGDLHRNPGRVVAASEW